MNKNTCTDVMVDALHRNGGIGYSTTLGIPHNAFDPTMHLQATSIEHLWNLPHRLENCLLYDMIVMLFQIFKQMRSSQARMTREKTMGQEGHWKRLTMGWCCF